MTAQKTPLSLRARFKTLLWPSTNGFFCASATHVLCVHCVSVLKNPVFARSKRLLNWALRRLLEDRALTFLYVICCILTLSINNHAIAQHSASTVNSLQDLMKGSDETPALAGAALAVMIDGEIIYQKAAGCAQFHLRKPHKCQRKLKPDTKMRMASISKMPLAMMIINLVQQGKINLDADASEYLGWSLRNPSYPEKPITVRHLLSHTSSLRDPDQYWALAPQMLKTRFDNLEIPFAERTTRSNHAPGNYFSYANINSSLLATIIELVTSQRFDQVMREQLFTPLQLDVNYNWSGVSKNARRKAATLYRLVDERWTAQIDDMTILKSDVPYFLADENLNKNEYLTTYKPGDNASLFSPQGGLRASVIDIAKLSQQMARYPLMHPPEWQANHSGTNGDTENNFFQSYGLGTQTIKGSEEFMEGYQFHGHPGEAYGLYSGAWNVKKNNQAQNIKQPVISIAFSVTGTAHTPKAGRHPGFNAVEEALVKIAMQAVEDHLSTEQGDDSHQQVNAHNHNTDDEPRPYHKDRNAKADVAATLERAKQSGKKPLLVLGANWCHDSRGLAARFEKPEFAALINDNYELVYVDVGRRDRNLDIARKYGIYELIGTPTVLILSPDNSKLLNGDTVHMWKRAASISDELTFDYFNSFAKGQIWQEPQE